MRALRHWLLVCSLLGACDTPCDHGTLRLTIDYSGASQKADRIDLHFDLPPVADSFTSTRSARAEDTLVLRFRAAYPVGKTLAIAATAFQNGAAIGSGQVSVQLTGACAVATLLVMDATMTDAGADGPVDATLADAGPDGAPANLVQNGSFESGFTDWNLRCDPGACGVPSHQEDTSTAHDGATSEAVFVAVASPTTPWHVQLYQVGVPTIAGTSYTFSFWAKSSTTGMQVTPMLQGQNDPYPAYWPEQPISLTTSWQPYSVSYTSSATDPAAQLEMNLGHDAGTVWIDSITLAAN
jgi:hypothetical protein